MRLTTLTQAIAEIDRFIGEDMPDDNQLVSEHKTAMSSLGASLHSLKKQEITGWQEAKLQI